jgi:hypothetical protein
MMTDNSKYAVTVTLSKSLIEDDPKHWEHVKQELIYKYMRDIFPEMIGDGKHHVMKFDYYKS